MRLFEHVPSQRSPAVPEQAARVVPMPVTGAPLVCVQTPPVPLQCSHCPVHAVSQQTLSAQLPERQSLPTEHVEPCGLRQRVSVETVVH